MALTGRRRQALLVGAGLVVGVVVGVLVASLLDSDTVPAVSTHRAVTTTTTAVTTPTTTGSTTTSPPFQPAACTSAAVGQGIQSSGAQVSSVDDFQCGGGWAGANYTTHGVSVAALLKDDGGQWVVVDRAQNCNDPSIPAKVHFYCTVS